MQNHKASNVKTKKSKTIIEVKPKIYPQRRKKKVTMVPMQNQNPANFANRIGRKFEVKTKHPSATAEKNMTKTFRHKPKKSADVKDQRIGRGKDKPLHNARLKSETTRLKVRKS